jgi:hypothetical protein
MNGFLALGNNEQIYHSVAGVTWTPAHYLLNGMQLSVVADDGAGNLVTGPVGGLATNKLLTSHDDGVSWTVTFTSPVAPGTILNATFSGGLHFYLNASNDTIAQAGNALWDGSQFALVGLNTSFPFVDMFSAGGDTWQVWAQTLDSVPGPATFYVPQDLLFFDGVYVGIVSLNHPSLIWSPTAGKGAGPISPPPQTDWTVGLAVPGGIATNCFFKTNGSYILAFGLINGGGDFVIGKSTDGKNWTTSAALNGLAANNGKDSVWWDPQLALWVLCGFDNGGTGLWTSPDGSVWTPRIYDPTFTISLTSVRRTGWFLSAVGFNGAFYISTDGVAWATINAACPVIADPWDLSFIHSTSNYFIALGTQTNSPFQTALVTSPNGTVWTARQNINSPDFIYNVLGPSGSGALTSYLNPCTGQPVFPPAMVFPVC